MNPSYEAMERARREKLASLLQIGREQTVKRLNELHLSGDSHAMLSQIAYAINPYVSAWDAESCDHLRRVLAELIGEACEAASGAEHRCACGAGGCDLGHEQTEIETERQEAVCELGKLMSGIDDLNSYYQFVEELFDALGVDDCPEDELCWDDRLISLCDRLIHLLGGEQPRITFDQDALVITSGENETRITNDDVIANGMSFADAFDKMTDGAYSRVFRGQSRTCPESEPDAPESDDGMSVTSELRKYVSIHETTTTVYATMPPQMEEEPTHKGKKLIAIADRIDAQFARVCEQHEVVLQDANNIQLLAECLKPVIADNDKRVAKLKAKLDFAKYMRYENARCAAVAANKACTYLDLLRDAARDYKALQNKLNLVFGMWVNATNGGTHE